MTELGKTLIESLEEMRQGGGQFKAISPSQETNDGEFVIDEMPTPIASYDAYCLANLFKAVYVECEEGGNLHILVSDANVDDDSVAYLLDKAETQAEKDCIEFAAQLSEGERWAAWLIANGREKELWP